MKQESFIADNSQDELTGNIERIVFHNEENGYTVLRLRTESTEKTGEFDTVVGHITSPQPGTYVHIWGKWTSHQKFGRQMVMERWEEERPSDEIGIRLFLASGCIKGIGAKWAERIVNRFKLDTFRILDEEPDKLMEIPRFGTKRLNAVKESWATHMGIRELMVFLQTHGIGPALTARIYKFYAQSALEIVKENPYRLAMDIHGVGFHTADTLAMNLGFEIDSPLRAEAGLLYSLLGLTDKGHIYYPKDLLISETAKNLEIDENILIYALENLLFKNLIVIEDLDDHKGVYSSRNHMYESKISYYLKRIKNSPRSVYFQNPEESVESVLSSVNIQLAEEQKEAVMVATKSKIMVITGGPGTGKTTIINTIIKIYQRNKAKVLLAAPTGRAAKRLSETSGCEAKTIHRLLEFSPQEDGFGRNENNPLACGLLVIDEASMMDTMLMYQLIKATPMGASIIFVGDVNQLPSVGPGNVLRDIIASGAVPVVELYEVFRQAAESDIISNAHKINKGEMPNFGKTLNTDFFFFKEDDPEKASELIVDLVSRRITERFAYKMDDIQVLTPLNKGHTGVKNLNQMLQTSLNNNTLCVIRGEQKYILGDKVMQIRNNYDKDVYNGDIGTIIIINSEEKELTIRFDDRNVLYAWEELDEITLSYAISIHKSQGGEYPVVIIPIMMQHYIMLQRNLLYTAVTRGRKMVVIVGEQKAIGMAVANNQIKKRYTWLAHRLAEDDGQLRMDMLPSFKVDDLPSDNLPEYEDLPEYEYFE